MQKTIRTIPPLNRTPQTGSHAAGHQRLDGNLARHVVFFRDADNARQHFHRSAGDDDIGLYLLNDFFQWMGNQALISGTAVIGGGLHGNPQLIKIFHA